MIPRDEVSGLAARQSQLMIVFDQLSNEPLIGGYLSPLRHLSVDEYVGGG